MSQEPPHVDGVMEFAGSAVPVIKTKLDAIISAFAPTDGQPVCDTFYIVAAYNKANKGNEINGDTAESLFR